MEKTVISKNSLIAEMERGKKLKELAAEKGIPIWWIARAIGLTDTQFSRKLRNLTDEEFQKLRCVVDELEK